MNVGRKSVNRLKPLQHQFQHQRFQQLQILASHVMQIGHFSPTQIDATDTTPP